MKHWIQAARLRTLPLSVSGILVGCFYAMSQSLFNWDIVIYSLTTTLGLQVLSNFANDYGDGVKGTDNEDRIGPKRAIQSGVISVSSMKKAIVITSILTLLSSILLIYTAFKEHNLLYSLGYLALGILAIASAIRYTVGKNPYGYRGFGDLFVFLFFGWVSTLGVYFMFAKTFAEGYLLFLPATAIGFLSVAVLNLNNMRDVLSDTQSGKNTLVVQMGLPKAKRYHYFLVISSMLLVLVFAVVNDFSTDGLFNFDQYFFLIVYIPLALHLKRVYQNQDSRTLDPELKIVALSTFFLAVLLSLGFIYFLSDLVVNNA